MQGPLGVFIGAFYITCKNVGIQGFGQMPPRKKARTCFQKWPDGPSCRLGVSNWPCELLDRTVTGSDISDLAAQRQLRLRTWLHNCLWQLTSDYSGYECFREALRCGHQACAERFSSWSVLPPKWRRSCDNDRRAQQILVWYAKEFDNGESCVLVDINDRLGEDAIKVLDGLEPAEKADFKEKARCRQAQLDWLDANKSSLFHAESTGKCLVHPSGRCHTFRPLDLEGSGSVTTLRVNVAGTCCQGWSNEGKQERHAHVSERPHAVWLCERQEAATQLLEDAFIQECTVLYPWIEKIKKPLVKTHNVVRIKVSPVDLAIPTNRPRSLVIATSLATLVWLGPDGDGKDVQLDYDEIFHRNCVATGDVFLNADEAEINAEMHRLANVQGHAWPVDFNVLDEIYLEEDLMLQCLPPGGYARYRQWENYRKERYPKDCTFLADCHHNAQSKGPAGGVNFPCELRTSCVIAHHLGRFVTPFEQLAAHGWHMHDIGGKWPASPVRKYMDTLTKGVIGKLAGNGISLPVAWSVWLYMLSNIAPREVPTLSDAEGRLCRGEFVEELDDDWD